MLIHSGENMHSCAQCKMFFSHTGSLKAHIFTHSREKTQKCTGCDYSTTQARSLREHVLTHTGVKLHRCTRCMKSFGKTGNLKTHMLTHTGEKPYKCSQCDFQPQQNKHLDATFFLTHNEKGCTVVHNALMQQVTHPSTPVKDSYHHPHWPEKSPICFSHQAPHI